MGKGTQQELSEVQVTALFFDLSVPDVRSIHQETVIIMGLQQVSESPSILSNGSSPLFGAKFFRLFQSQAKPVGGVGSYGNGVLPVCDLAAELPKLGLFPFDHRAPTAQGVQPGVVGRVKAKVVVVLLCRLGRPGHIIDNACNELAENGLTGNRRRLTRFCLCHRSGGRRHQVGKFCQPVGVISDKDWRPDRHCAPVPLGNTRQETLAHR